MKKRFEGKTAIVTGGSRGIGRAVALLLAEEGANVVVVYREAVRVAEEVVSVIEKNGGKAFALQCDVSDEEDVGVMFKDVRLKCNRIDILINNAGIVIDKPMKERTVTDWQKTLGTNLIGTFLCARSAAEEMKKSGGGAIVNVASTNGLNCYSPYAVDYDASKAGVMILTKDLAKEYAPFIRVNAVAPGWVDTEMNEGLAPDYIETETAKIQLGRFAKSVEIAKVIVFLASEDASYMNGSIVVVDGGREG